MLGRESTQWSTDLLFKKPWPLSKKADRERHLVTALTVTGTEELKNPEKNSSGAARAMEIAPPTSEAWQ